MKNKITYPFYVIVYYRNDEFVAYSKHSIVQPWVAQTESLKYAKKYKNKGSAVKRAEGIREIYKWDKDIRIEVEKIVEPKKGGSINDTI